MPKCIKCGEDYDPGESFINDTTDCEIFLYFTSATPLENTCGECGEELIFQLRRVVSKFYWGE